jgi:hypothetical protein
MGAPVVVDAEPAWHRAADLAVALGVDVWDTSDTEGKMCFIFPIRSRNLTQEIEAFPLPLTLCSASRSRLWLPSLSGYLTTYGNFFPIAHTLVTEKAGRRTTATGCTGQASQDRV